MAKKPTIRYVIDTEHLCVAQVEILKDDVGEVEIAHHVATDDPLVILTPFKGACYLAETCIKEKDRDRVILSRFRAAGSGCPGFQVEVQISPRPRQSIARDASPESATASQTQDRGDSLQKG